VRLDPAGAAGTSSRRRRAETPPPRRHWFEADPLWFKTAVFYEIHLRGVLRRQRATAPATSAG
jgi:maltose alpha-D-glucosyltransferase/alpha-amylase